ncbi:GNAT family N-acetyltransferase [Pseudomonas fluorescens]|uniref:GNAT family N-acetyltransferase n=1 Tax=Pseudomonas lactucae TaxID=2813360 RepID=A0A9X0YG96_9PSED|nr:GNAT family protein [Pseudomonas lactucae]OPA94361.1 GNAT family N-acetyltransferase [Pseudomonas fluorescens]MBN2979450.1 GNAT family N-acetyltransferase [Pseudomonas lactucae]MBN2986424.1 GNAT family N-acetyltransferase [Pseudomonas lactucae]OPB13181.1 GNAT family N-acetyltransferase [Pseudomonas fluorescens]OPB24286.1 GNAT family N-acetyltransferase [Pseudomonas fluorescens]
MSSELPCLSTPRLLLRALEKHQAETLSTLANGPKIADDTASIPSPYTLQVALDFIEGMQEKFRAEGVLSLGMHRRDSGELIGVLSLRVKADHLYGNLGGWVAAQARNQGYAAEAASALMDYGFTELGLYRVGSQCFSRNKASARVMEKIGLRYEGCLRGAFLKNGVHEDMLVFATLRKDWALRS